MKKPRKLYSIWVRSCLDDEEKENLVAKWLSKDEAVAVRRRLQEIGGVFLKFRVRGNSVFGPIIDVPMEKPNGEKDRGLEGMELPYIERLHRPLELRP